MSRFVGFMYITACASCAVAAPPSAKVSPPPGNAGGVSASFPIDAGGGEAPNGAHLFEDLVGMVHRYHVFAPQTEKNLGRRWESSLPRLRDEFTKAKSRDALALAAWHFGNSLHDVHCQFRPKERGVRLKLGLRANVEKHEGRYRFFVERVWDDSLKKVLSVGDIIVSIDGVPAEKFLDEFEFVSNMNSLDNVALDIAQHLGIRRTSTTAAREGDKTSWVVRPREGGEEHAVIATWRNASNGDDSDFALDYENKDCVNAGPKDYGPYAMTARGYRVCVYASTAPKYREYPIVRQVSFRYDEFPHGPLADYGLLRSMLSKSRPKGVLLDVQDNGGGMNPNVFLEWWSDKPYEDLYTHMLLDDALLRDSKGEVHISSLSEVVQNWYEGEIARRKPGQRVSSARPFMCKPETCVWENRYIPKHRVTPAPIALLLGPGCASSCDTVAWHFDKGDLGPIIGRPPMGGFTTHRARFDVVGKSGEPPLGTIDFAISFDTPPGGSESIEGSQVHIDVPVSRTFDNAGRYDKVLVEAAIGALEERRR